MPKTLLKPRLHFDKLKQKNKAQIQNTTRTVPQKSQTFEQKLLLGTGFVVYN